jgi:hypothetical protein
VKGAVAGLRIDQPQLGINLAAEQMQQTPLLARPYHCFAAAQLRQPAINQGDIFVNEVLITTNGAGRRQAWFEVDGANNNMDMWGGQTIFTNIPLMAVEEMSVLTNAFTPG